MLKDVFEILVSLFAIYGFFVALMEIISSISRKIPDANPMVKVIYIVKNQENNIEGVLRELSRSDLLGRVLLTGKLTVIDMDSTDDTYLILKKIKQEYEFLEVLRKDEIYDIFEDM